MIRAVLALTLLAAPALADRPHWLVATVCNTTGDCHLRYVPIYDAPVTSCAHAAQAELATLLLPGETVERWRCE